MALIRSQQIRFEAPLAITGSEGNIFINSSGSATISKDLTVSGTLYLANPISGSVLTSSYAVSSSYALTSSFVNTLNQNLIISGSVIIQGTASINTLIVNQLGYYSGSNQFGDAADDTQTLYGTVRIPTGSFTVSGSSYFTGSLNLGTGTVLYGDTANSSLILDQTTGAYLKYGTTSEIGLLGSITRLRAANSIQLQTGTTTHLFVSSSGNVGIGTVAPSYTLDISGSLRVGTPTATPHLVFARASNNYITTPAGGAILFNLNNTAVENSSIVSIYSTGLRVGTGFSNPSAVAHVRGSGITSATTALRVENTNTSASLTVLDNGYVGIGSTAPLRQLYVVGDIEVTNGIYGDATDHTFYTIASGSFHHRFYSRTSGGTSLERFTIEGGSDTANAYFQNTNLGIGTTAPGAKLEIRATGSNETTQRWLDSAGNLLGDFAELGDAGVLRVGYAVSAVSTARPLITLDGGSSNSTAAISLRSKSSVTNIRISSDIGSYISGSNLALGYISGTAPAILSISGSASETLLAVGSPISANILYVSGSGNVGIGTTSPESKLHVSVGSIFIDNNFSYRQKTNSGGNVGLIYIDSSNLMGIYDGKVNITSTGNVGIGTTSPTVKLDISGSIRSEIPSDGNFITLQATGQRIHFIKRAGQILQFTSDAATTYDVRFDSSNSSVYILSGSVGIGTTAPVSKLQVAGNGATYGEAITWTGATDYGGANRGYVGYDAAAATTAYIGNEFTGGDGVSARFQIRMGTSPKLTVMSGGNVGIGNNSPSASLHISGASASGLLQIDSPVSSSILFVNGSGNVGVGTNNPFARLTIQTTTNTIAEQPAVSVTNGGTFGGWLIYSGSSEKARYAWNTTDGAYVYTPGTDPFTIYTNAGRAFRIDSSRNVGIGTNAGTISARTHIVGSGATSATTAFLIQNSTPTALLTIRDDGNASFNGNTQITGSLTISASAGTGSAFSVYKSGSTVMSIQGSQGELFSITDSLSGSLFSVSNISGLPILEVFSDNTVLLGSYLDPMLMTTQRLTANSGSTVIYSLPTSSYDGIFVDYVIRSGSNARAGQFMGMWSGSTTTYTDNSTTDFGSTSGFNFGLIISGSNMVLTGSASTSGWTVRAGIRSI
jgi:hypothetical protein